MNHCNICDPKQKYNDCICGQNFSNFFDTYNSITDEEHFENILIKKPWSISTMTVCCKFNSTIDLEKYRNNYLQNESHNNFYNCINTYCTIKYQIKQKISIKIFTNGNIQLAGILNVRAACYAVRKIFRRLNKIEAFNDCDNCKISDLRICMINSDFKISNNIKQTEMCKILETDNMIKSYSFIPSKYPAINCKLNCDNGSVITCAIFRPGSIMITGGNDIKEYKKIYFKILNILSNNKNILY